MNHIGLFEGVGGFSLAAKWMGWTTKAWCEWNPFGQQVLRYHYPEAEGHGDITKTDFTKYANTIDILTGGFPCQPFSTAGKRKGTEDERYLWPEMLRAIREVQPRWIVGENVAGLINWDGGLVFDTVHTDLEAEGYEVTPFLLPACAVNAPHRRDRIWFVAYAGSKQFQKRTPFGNSTHSEEERAGMDNRIKLQSNIRDAANSNSYKRCERGLHTPGQKETKRHVSTRNARSDEQATWHNFPTQPPLCSRNDGLSTGLSGITFSKHRNESIKAYGNAIVPQVAFEIFKAIEQYESRSKKQ